MADGSNAFEWARDVIRGVGGFHDYEHYEVAVWTTPEDRDVGVAYFVLQSLANPKCEGSERMLRAIEERRREVAGGR